MGASARSIALSAPSFAGQESPGLSERLGRADLVEPLGRFESEQRSPNELVVEVGQVGGVRAD